MNEHIHLRLSFIPAILVSGLALLAVPSFVQIYTGLGAELPVQTVFLIRWYKGLALIPFIFLLAWFFWPRRESRGIATLCLSSFLSGAVLLFGMWAAYAPIFMLGSPQ